MSPRALVLLAQGAEEMETTIIVDVLRRADVDVVLAGVDGGTTVTCSRGVRIVPDAALEAVDGKFDIVVMPGGTEGAERLAQSAAVGARLRAQWDDSGFVAAMCAAPIALRAHGIATGHALTSHPSVQTKLVDMYRVQQERVVTSGRLITSQGPGTSFEFALAMVSVLCGAETATRVAGPMLLPSS